MAAKKTTATETEPTETKADAVKTVAMVRDPEIYPAPHTADVHPDSVEEYRLGGWEIAK